jgi:hypothetical protein
MAKKAQTAEPVETQEEATERSPIRRATAEEKRLFDSIAEATAGKPDRPSWALFQITDPKGRQRFTWAPYYASALWQAVIDTDESYSVVAVDELPSKVEVDGYLAALSPKEREELLAKYGKKK